MKKTFALVLALLICLISLIGCSKTNEPVSSEDTQSGTNSDSLVSTDNGDVDTSIDSSWWAGEWYGASKNG